jgi:hypothetical protein
MVTHLMETYSNLIVNITLHTFCKSGCKYNLAFIRVKQP